MGFSDNQDSKTECIPEDDSALMVRIVAGDPRAYNDLYKAYYRVVLNYLASQNGRAASLEDLTQEVFVRVWQARHSYTGISTLKTFLCGIAKNVALEHFRQEKRWVDGQNCRVPPPEQAAPDAALEQERIADCIEAAKAKLTDKQYFALEIALSPSVSLAQAAQRAGLSESTLRQRVREGRKRMYELLKASKAL